MKHEISVLGCGVIYIDNERVFGSKPYGLFSTVNWSATDEDLKRIADRCLELVADRKTEPQTIRCPKCGRTDYIRDMEKDMGIKGSHYKYKCINCNFYIKTEPTISKMEQVDKDINVRSKERSSE